MASKALNTRVAERYKPQGRSIITIGPTSTHTKIAAHLLDLNKFGGLGIFVSARTAFDRLTLDSFLEPWTVTRASTKGEISFTVSFFHAIPRTEDGRKGIRISAILSEKQAGAQSSKFFMSPRRRSKRISREKYPVYVGKTDMRIEGRLLNVGEDDGAGIGVERPQLGAITWGELFQNGWVLGEVGYSLPFYIQRISMQDGQIVLGGSAPGITRARAESPLVGAEAPKVKVTPKVTAVDDDELMDLLDDVLAGKKKR